MPDINSLGRRIDAECSAAAEKIRRFQGETVHEHKARQKQLQQLGEPPTSCVTSGSHDWNSWQANSGIRSR